MYRLIYDSPQVLFCLWFLQPALKVYSEQFINISQPWVMQGFPGKVRELAWSDKTNSLGAPLLAASSSQGISVWERDADESVGWEGWALEVHENVVSAIAFEPTTFLLASAVADGQVCLRCEAEQLLQILEGAEGGFSCLARHPDGQFLAGGGCGGELLVWSKSMRGKEFGRH